MYSDYEYIMTSDGELYHYGVKGMKWGHRKRIEYAGEGVVSRKKKKQPDYGINPNAGKPTLGTSEHAIKTADQLSKGINAVRKTARKINEHASKRKTERVQQEQYGKLEDAYIYKNKIKEKHLRKAYGKIEDSLTYNKRANKKANEFAEKALEEIDKELSKTGKNPKYNAKRVNEFLDKALDAIIDDYDKYHV